MSFTTNSVQGTNTFKFWKFFFRVQADKIKKSNLCGVLGVSFIPFHSLDYGTNIHYLTEYSSPSVLDRGNPSKQQACKILNILWNLCEVKHLIFRDFAIYKSQPIKPKSQPVTAVACQTFFAGRKQDHPYLYHLFGISTEACPGLHSLLMVSTDS